MYHTAKKKYPEQNDHDRRICFCCVVGDKTVCPSNGQGTRLTLQIISLNCLGYLELIISFDFLDFGSTELRDSVVPMIYY